MKTGLLSFLFYCLFTEKQVAHAFYVIDVCQNSAKGDSLTSYLTSLTELVNVKVFTNRQVLILIMNVLVNVKIFKNIQVLIFNKPRKITLFH